MKLELTYKQLALLRELLNNESNKIFLNKAKLSKEKGFEQLSLLQEKFKKIDNQFLREGLCHTLLKEIEKIEERIQQFNI